MGFPRTLAATVLLGAGICLSAAPGFPQSAPPAAGSTTTGGPAATGQGAAAAPDNTGANKAANRGATADQQKENKTDRELTRQIRRVLRDDKSLSTYARNVKIVAQRGKVTLKGPVRSEAEKQAIENAATQVAGAGNVTSEISIAEKRG